MESDSKFVDLGADSLDTVSSASCHPVDYSMVHQCSTAKTESSHRTVGQVEIMMALEEKFDLQLDEEGVQSCLLI